MTFTDEQLLAAYGGAGNLAGLRNVIALAQERRDQHTDEEIKRLAVRVGLVNEEMISPWVSGYRLDDEVLAFARALLSTLPESLP